MARATTGGRWETYEFSTSDGSIEVRIPTSLTPDDFTDFEEFMGLVMRSTKKRIGEEK